MSVVETGRESLKTIREQVKTRTFSAYSAEKIRHPAGFNRADVHSGAARKGFATRRGGPDQPSHVVVGKSVGSGRIGNLPDFPDQVVDVFHAGRVGVSLLRQTVHIVVDVIDDLAFAICFADEIVVRIVGILLVVCRREARFGDSAECVLGERGYMAVRVGDAVRHAWVVTSLRGWVECGAAERRVVTLVELPLAGAGW